MRVLLIEPPFMRLKRRSTAFLPIGLGYLASSLARAGHEPTIYNAEMSPDPIVGDGAHGYQALFAQHRHYKEALRDSDHPVWREIRTVIERYRPGLVGITVRSAKLPAAARIASIAKSVDERCLVAMGGPHPTIDPDGCARCGDVDFVVRGEGERTFVELCEALESNGRLDAITGLSYLGDSGFVHNPPRPLIEDLDSLPFPARANVHAPELYPPASMGVIVTSRGCPYRCGYCSASSMWTRRVRYRSTENVFAEIQEITGNYKISDLSFWDDSFTVNRKRTLALCRAIIDHKLRIRWMCTSRVDLLDDELLGVMKEAGCTRIDLGIETGSERMLKLIDKGIDLSLVERATKLINKHKIGVGAFFMAGFPDETTEDIRQTIQLMKSVKAASLCFSIFTPYPGSALYDRARELGLIPERIAWEDFDHQSPENYFVKNIERDEFDRLVAEMIAVVDENQRDTLGKKLSRMRADSRYHLSHPGAFMAKATRAIVSGVRSRG